MPAPVKMALKSCLEEKAGGGYGGSEAIEYFLLKNISFSLDIPQTSKHVHFFKFYSFFCFPKKIFLHILQETVSTK